MNQKLAFQDLVALLSEATSQSSQLSEDFIKEFANIVSETLANGETVRIKGLGEFSPAPELADKLQFHPDDALAAKVNAPFSHFTAQSIGNDITTEQLNAIEPIETPVGEIETVEHGIDDCVTVSSDIIVDEEPLEAVEDEVYELEDAVNEKDTDISSEDNTEAEEGPEIEIVEVATHESASTEPLPETSTPAKEEGKEEITPATQPVPVIIPIEEDEEEIFTPEKSTVTPPRFVSDNAAESQPAQEQTEDSDEGKSSGFGLGMLLGFIIGLAIGAAGMFFYAGSMTPKSSIEENEPTEIIESQPSETSEPVIQPVSTQAVEEQPAAEEVAAPEVAAPEAPKEVKPVTDKIAAGYLMPKMAQKHYGHAAFWVYIYEENKSKIPNPNNIPAGLELVIPPAEKYGIDASNPQSVAAAQAKESKLLK